MATKAVLPFLHISQVGPVLDWELEAENARTKIEFALRRLTCEQVAQKTIQNWSIHVYRYRDTTKDVLASLATDLSDSDEEQAPNYEYLIFLFQGTLNKTSSVFVLSTNKAYKQIQCDCSMQFPRLCSKKLGSVISCIQKISTSQVFGKITESSFSVQQSPPEIMNQSGLICREFTAVGTGIKVKFKEYGILIYQDPGFSLDDYVKIIENLAPSDTTISVFEWDIPGLPDGNLKQVDGKTQEQLNNNVCAHLAGIESAKWTFNLRISERWYSNASKFRIVQERRRYGKTKGREIEPYPYDLPNGTLPSDFDLFKKALQSNFVGYKVDEQTSQLRDLLCNFVQTKQVSIEHLSTDGNWYRNYLIDCVDGWVRTDKEDVYFKLGTLWYQIQNDYVNLVRNLFTKVVSLPKVILCDDDAGYLFQPWPTSVDETTYNKSYINLNPKSSSFPMWFDGNQKLRSRMELFDILKIEENNNVFIYHVKKEFGAHIRECVSQLVLSAQVIFNTRNGTDQHPDTVETKEYCKRVSNEATQLLKALKTGSLHFVLAFKSDDVKQLKNSASLIAMRETIRAKEEIEKLGFTFNICPIASEQTKKKDI